MPSEIRRTTLARRRRASLIREYENSKRFFNNDNLDDVACHPSRVDLDAVNDQRHLNKSGNITTEADPKSYSDNEQIMSPPVGPSNDHMLENNSHQGSRVNSPQNKIVTGSKPSTNQRKEFATRKLSTISEEFVENMNIVTHQSPIKEFNIVRKLIGKVVNDDRVQGVILALIVINAIIMGVATFPAVKYNPNINSTFQVIDQIFLVIFTIEAAMQVLYHGWTIFKDAFLVFDLTIVVLSWAAEGVKVIRAFRVFRALRLVTRVGTMRNLILALISVTPNLTGISMLLFLVFYIFAVLFTQLYKDSSKQYPREEQYFIGLPETFFTLFQMMTLDGWSKIYRQASEEHYWSWIPFIVFIVVTAFVFANLIIAVICDAIHVLDDEDVAGLTGYEEDVVTKERDAVYGKIYCRVQSQTSQRLREIERQLNIIVVIHNKGMETLELLVKSFANEQPVQSTNESHPVKSISCDIDATEKVEANNPSQYYSQAIRSDSLLEIDKKLEYEDRENFDQHQENESVGGIEIYSRSLQKRDGINGITSSSQNEGCQRTLSKGILHEPKQFFECIQRVTESPTVSHLNDARKLIGRIVNDSRAQGFILLLVIINSVMMGVATFPVVKDNPIISAQFQIIDEVFLIIFTIEASMQLIYHGWTIFKDAFLVFDLTIVALSWALEGVQVARAFRVFRALRLLSRVDTMKNLILAVTSVTPNLTGIAMLLFLVFYIFAVMFTQMFRSISEQYPREEQYFVGLPETFFTLFQMMTLDGWRKMYLQVSTEYAWSWIPIISFVVASAFIFVNLMIAVICDAVHVMGNDEAAGLLGCDESKISETRSNDMLACSKDPRNMTTSGSLGQKLRELEKEIDELISMQKELLGAIDLISRARSGQIQG